MNTFDKQSISALRSRVKERISERRYKHTEGVASTAIKIGEILIPGRIDELECAALIHDAAKELPKAEILSIAAEMKCTVTAEDLASPAVLHAVVGPAVILRDFPEYATENILSAVRKHTTGDADMSVFDEIIFISDYIEEGRTYPSCIETRNEFFRSFSNSNSYEKNILALHKAVYRCLKNTVEALSARGDSIHIKTKLAIDTFASLI